MLQSVTSVAVYERERTMAFIRKRLTPTRGFGVTEHYQLLESYRENGKVKQRVVCNLGRCPTIEEALKKAEADLAHGKEWLEWLKNTPPPPRRFTRGWTKRKNGEELKTEWIASQEVKIWRFEERIRLLRSVKNIVT